MVLCMFTTYGLIPKAVHNLDPKSLKYKAIATIFENLGPLFRISMSVKAKRRTSTTSPACSPIWIRSPTISTACSY